MTIRFRCCHCKQLMAIADVQCGKAVDCPMCGRGIRVPVEDMATATPVNDAGFDTGDSQLASALSEVAHIGDSAEASEAAVSTREPESVVTLQPQTTQTVHVPEPQSTQVVEFRDAGPVGISELDSLIAQEDPAIESVPRSRTRTARPPEVGFPWLASTFVIVAFLAGLFCGKLTWDKPVVQLAAEEEKPTAKAQPVARPAALSGRVTFQSNSGDSKPDAGARVIIFSEDYDGEPLSSNGMLSNPSDAAFVEFSRRIQVAGGNVSVCDSNGNYQSDLAAGQYRILVVSHFLARNEQEEIPASLETYARKWFDRGEQILGQRAYAFDALRYRGEGTETRDFQLAN